ncbi:hypothetical protein BHE74_00046860 [Ensete ventricosum]|nr:hypothetical protein BHE74_00046860 [Ensete ventricosum]
MSNVVMAIAVMITLLFLTPLFHYTPLVVLSAIIISAMLGLIDYEAAIHLWHVDKVDFCVCLGAYLGVVFVSVEIGLVIAVRLHLHSESSTVRRKAEDHRARQHPKFHGVPAGGSVSGGTNCSRGADPPSLTSQSGLFGGDQLVLANPGSEVMKKLSSSKILDAIGHEWIFLTVADAVAACNFMLHTCKPSDTTSCENVV